MTVCLCICVARNHLTLRKRLLGFFIYRDEVGNSIYRLIHLLSTCAHPMLYSSNASTLAEHCHCTIWAKAIILWILIFGTANTRVLHICLIKWRCSFTRIILMLHLCRSRRCVRQSLSEVAVVNRDIKLVVYHVYRNSWLVIGLLLGVSIHSSGTRTKEVSPWRTDSTTCSSTIVLARLSSCAWWWVRCLSTGHVLWKP